MNCFFLLIGEKNVFNDLKTFQDTESLSILCEGDVLCTEGQGRFTQQSSLHLKEGVSWCHHVHSALGSVMSYCIPAIVPKWCDIFFFHLI